MQDLIIERIDPSLPMPTYAHEGDAGFDLLYYVPTSYDYKGPIPINPGEMLQLRTGIKLCIPSGYEVQLRSKSGMTWHYGLVVANSPGTIDSGYTAEVSVLLMNISDRIQTVASGQKICQAVLAPVTRANIVEGKVENDTDRGEGGFGSTGK